MFWLLKIIWRVVIIRSALLIIILLDPKDFKYINNNVIFAQMQGKHTKTPPQSELVMFYEFSMLIRITKLDIKTHVLNKINNNKNIKIIIITVDNLFKILTNPISLSVFWWQNKYSLQMVYLYSSDQVLQSTGFEELALPRTFKEFPRESLKELNHLGSYGSSRG